MDLLLRNMIWPAIMNVAIIFFLVFILDRKKSSLRLGLVFFILGIGSAAYFIYTASGDIFLQLYLFMFLLSISLVILALKKRIDAFTIIGILLMIVMLIILLRFTII